MKPKLKRHKGLKARWGAKPKKWNSKSSQLTDVSRQNGLSVMTINCGATDTDMMNQTETRHILKNDLHKKSVDEWQAEDVCDYIVGMVPEMDRYRNNIMSSNVTGIEFICMQNADDFATRFKMKDMRHIVVLLTITQDLLMDYSGTNNKILSLKSNYSKDWNRVERIRSMSSVC